MQRQAAFTLVEILVVVALISLLTAYGFTTYGRFSEKIAVENAAKELITFIRTTQMRSRNGDRGTGSCRQDVTKIADGSSKLNGWKVKFTAQGATSNPVCNNSDGTGGYQTKEFEKNVKVYCCHGATASSTCSNQYLYTKSVFGDTWYNRTTASADAKNHIFVTGDGTYYYRFVLANGSISNGRYCANLTECCSRSATDWD